MSLNTVIASLEAAAKAEWQKIKDEAIVIEQKIEVDLPTALETLASQFGSLIMSTISNLATAEFAALTGGEKANLAATTIVDKIQVAGASIIAEDATALVKWGYEAFKDAAAAVSGHATAD